MPLPVLAGAQLLCPFGLSPGTLMVVPAAMALMESRPPAVITDIAPFVNIIPFGVCTSLTNPVTASQTAAASGVLTPGPCTPVITGPWKPGAPMTLIGGIPALTQDSTCQCGYGGVITITNPGAAKEIVA